MHTLRINGQETSLRVIVARSFIRRTVGLMGEKRGDHAMLFPRCRSIHTCFMRYPIDVVCLDEHATVVRTMTGCRPWRIVMQGKTIRHILEIPSGRLPGVIIKIGDKIDVAELIP